MGGTSSSELVAAEIRLECPRSHSSRGAFFAQLHTAAEGSFRYEVWGRTQQLSLLLDDVITVSIYTAQSEEHFDKLLYDEFAEVYLPWETVSRKIKAGREEVFVLGLQPGTRWLRHAAQPSHYQAAFSSSCRAVRECPSSPYIRIGIRVLSGQPDPAGGTPGPPEPQGSPMEQTPPPHTPERRRRDGKPPGSGSAAVACGIEELSPEEMKQLFQLQMKNKELRAQLGIGNSVGPDVDEQVQEHLGKLRQAVTQNYALRSLLQQEDRQEAELAASLTPKQQIQLGSASATPVQSSVDLSAMEEQEYERMAAAITSDIQAATNANIEMIAAYDQQIKVLEAELAAGKSHTAAVEQAQSQAEERLVETERRLRSQLEELEVLEGESAQLEAMLSELPVPVKQEELDATIKQQLQIEVEVQEQEIVHIQHILKKNEEEGVPLPPNTGVLQDQVAMLQCEHSEEEERCHTEREQRERQVEEIRTETAALREELELVNQVKQETEQGLTDLKAQPQPIPAGRGDREREQIDEEVLRESLLKEVSRCGRRIEFYDEKIECLREEADDIRLRASQALRATLAGPVEDTERIAKLEEVVRAKEVEAHLLQRREDNLRQEREEVRQAHETSAAFVASSQEKLERLLAGGTRPLVN